MAVVGFDNISKSKLHEPTFMLHNESTSLDLMRLSPAPTIASAFLTTPDEMMKTQTTSTVQIGTMVMPPTSANYKFSQLDSNATLESNNRTGSNLSLAATGTIMPPPTSQTITSKEMLMQTSVHHAPECLDAQASSSLQLQVDTAQQRELCEIEGCFDSGSSLNSVTSIGSLSLCLSDIILDATVTQAKLLREANNMELDLDDREYVAEIDMAATVRADLLFEQTVSVVLNQTKTSTISSLSNSHNVTTCETTKLVSKRSVGGGKWRLSSSSRRGTFRKTTGGMMSSLLKKRSINRKSEVASPNTNTRPEVTRSNNALELSEDRLHSYKVKTDGKLARCVADDGNTS